MLYVQTFVYMQFLSLFSLQYVEASEPPSHVQLIVKACPAAEQTGLDHKPDAVLGYYADPINQGLVYNRCTRLPKRSEKPISRTQHCIDVPIPPEVTIGGEDSTEMTMSQCMRNRGYISAMQSLEMNPVYRTCFPAVGAWECIEQPFAASGVDGM